MWHRENSMEYIAPALISAAVTVLVVLLTRWYDRPKSEADLAQRWKQIAGETLDEWIKGRQERDAEVVTLVERLGAVEQAAAGGPFRIQLEFTTVPLKITSQKISLVVTQNDCPEELME